MRINQALVYFDTTPNIMKCLCEHKKSNLIIVYLPQVRDLSFVHLSNLKINSSTIFSNRPHWLNFSAQNDIRVGLQW